MIHCISYDLHNSLIKDLDSPCIPLTDGVNIVMVHRPTNWKGDGVSRGGRGWEAWVVKYEDENGNIVHKLFRFPNVYGTYTDPTGRVHKRGATGKGLFYTLKHCCTAKVFPEVAILGGPLSERTLGWDVTKKSMVALNVLPRLFAFRTFPTSAQFHFAPDVTSV
jgi:hypothetical protein